MSTEAIKEIEKTRKILKTAKKNHRLTRAKYIGKRKLILLFWVSFTLYLYNCIGLGLVFTLIPPLILLQI